jgi:hypothetical protein
MLDGDLVVGLERGDSVVGDLCALGVSVEVEVWWVVQMAYVKPLIRVNSLTWETLVGFSGYGSGGGAYDLAALVLDVLLGLLEVVVGGILCEGDLEG